MIQQMLKFYPYLTMRNHTYYVRIRIPNHLAQIAGRKNFFYSLRTKDYAQAINLVKEATYKTDLLIQSYERKYREMLKLRHKERGEIKLCLTRTEVQHIFVIWWCELLKKLERYEDAIKSCRKTFKDFCFYHPDKLEPWERVEFIDHELENGETYREEIIIEDVYDGYKNRTVEEERRSNPNNTSQRMQLYEFIKKVLQRDVENHRMDRELIC